jgi:fibronectin-binding autotransporter adhesin
MNAFAGPLVVGGSPYFFASEARWLNSYQHASAEVTVYDNGFVNLNNQNEDFIALTFNGAGWVQTGTGELGIYGPVTANLSGVSAYIYGKLRLPSGVYPKNPFIVNDGALPGNGLAINAAVLGSGNLVKYGSGLLLLSGSNTYSGATFVYDGILQASSSTALGANNIGQGTIVYNGATLRLQSATFKEPLSLSGSGFGGTNGALQIFGDVFFISPLPVLNSFDLTSGATIRVEYPGTTFDLDSIVSGTGPLTKTGPGSMMLFGGNGIYANTYSGDTVDAEGTLELDTPFNVIAVPGNLVVGPPPPGGVQAVTRFDNSAQFGGTVATVNGNALLDLSGNNLALSQLNLNDGGDVQTGAGVLSFPPDMDSAVNVGSQTTGSHHSSTITGHITLPTDGGVTFFVAPYAFFAPFDFNPELDISAVVTGPGTLAGEGIYKTGQGQMRLSGNNTFAGFARVNDGALIVANAGALGSTAGATFVNNGAKLALDGGIAINNEALFLSSSNTIALDSRSGSNTWSGTIALSQPTGISVSQAGGYLQVLNSVSGTGGLTKSGPGTLQFWGFGPNTYTGGTTVSGGTLEAGRVNQVSVPGNVIVGDDTTTTTTAILRIDREQQFSPAANLTIHSSGNLYLNDLPSLGVPTPTIGTLSGGGTVFLGANASLTVSNSAFCSFSGPISGPGVFNKSGTGLMQLTGDNTYTGTTTISGGTLQVDGSQPQSAVQFGGGARLQGLGTVGALSLGANSSAVAPGDGPGILTCSNFNASSTISGVALEIELNGTTPGVGYDQLNVHGSVTLGPKVNLNASLNFTSSLSDTFTIINNDGADPVIGTFTGLAQGATLNIGSQSFQISYTGGDGNDVVLTHTLPTLTATATAGGILIKNPDLPAYPYNSTVTLTAIPIVGYVFTGWSGDAIGTQNPLALTMTSNKVITASFASTVSDLIVDNTNAAFTGTWTTDSGSVGTGFFAQDFRYATTVSSGSATATFRPNLPLTGNYDVYVWYPFLSQNNKRCKDTEYTISSSGGTNTVSVDETSGFSSWVLIASSRKFSQGTNALVQLSNQSTDTSRYAAADAVRWAWSTNQVTQPYFTSVTKGPTNATLTWLSGSNYVYRLHYKTNLTDAAWLDVSGDVTATTNIASKTDSSLGNNSTRFYRVELLQ